MSDRPRVLVIAPQPFFTPRGTPFSVYYRTLVMAEQGANVDLLTYGEGEDVCIPNVRIIRIPRIPGTARVPIGPSYKKIVLDVFMILWTIGLLIKNRYKAVHAHEESIFWCRVLKPLFRFRLIYDMHSSLPQQLSNFKFSKSSLLIGVFHWLEGCGLRGADAVITICPDLRDYALSRGVSPSHHLLIENSIFDDVKVASAKVPIGASASEVKHRERRARQAAHGLQPPSVEFPPGMRLILYAGTFELYQGIDLVVKAFARVSKEDGASVLLLVGGAPDQVKQMQSLATELQLGPRCIFTGRVSKTEALRVTARADLLLSPRRSGTNTPLKIYEQLASGKPLIATRIWSHTQVLTDEVCFLVDPEPDSIAAGILAALRDPERARRLAANALALYEREYARPVYERKIRSLLELVS
jgi:glycosyltransferase involved in cell wall biosynthesis